MKKSVIINPKDGKCGVCGEPLNDGAIVCKGCKSSQPGKECTVCKAVIPLTADYCNTCKFYQRGWLRWVTVSQVTLALLIALATTLSPAINALIYLWDYNSHTSAIVTFADAHFVTLYAWNTGR